jgi:uncharacterized protein YkwD
MFRAVCWWLAAVLLAPHVAAAESEAVRSARPPFTVTADDLAQRVHALVNAERKKAKLPALAWNPALGTIATGHSRDMAERNYFAHESPEGRDFAHRYQQAGFECAVRAGRNIWTGAENIALARLYNSSHRVNKVVTYDWNSPADIARMTVEGWMKSPGHRENILTPHWRRQGIGVVIAPENRILITQNFC